jgi:hypothetical protein
MSKSIILSILASAAMLSVALPEGAQAQQANMSFFVTSTGSGKGADLGGLAGADQRCQQLRKPPARPARPGTLISALKRRTASPPLMREIASGMVRGRTPRA